MCPFLLDHYIICGLTSKNYNNVFLDLLKYINKHKNAENFISYLREKTADSNLWPDDNRLKDKFLNRSIYQEEKGKSKALVNILLEIEHHIRTSKQEKINISPDNLTIEHIMPQKWFEHWSLYGKSVSEEDFEYSYQKSFSEEDENGYYHKIENRKRVLNTIGNLTLLTNSLNPSVSNGSFNRKRPEIVKQSSLKLNTYFHDIKEWNESKIKERCAELFNYFINIWEYPNNE